jgi:peptidoglycan hydrolase-like protein with peptidoglycan-binding domain
MPWRVAAVVAVGLALLLAPSAWGRGRASVAALQTGLATKGFYRGPVDGVAGPATTSAVRRLQRRAGLVVDGVVGPQTRRALGRFGRPRIGSRVLSRGAIGWDVAALQFELAWHGFPSWNFDGVLGSRTQEALVAFQAWAGLVPDGLAGPATWEALRRPPAACPIALAWPVSGGVSSGFGPRGRRFHAGLDLSAAEGTPVGAARTGRVVFAGWNDGFGKLVTVAHTRGVVTMYAHLSRIDVGPGERLGVGEQLGLVGQTGRASGPHLHFEVRVRNAAVDPLSALG